jgi:hypothetical protein
MYGNNSVILVHHVTALTAATAATTAAAVRSLVMSTAELLQ